MAEGDNVFEGATGDDSNVSLEAVYDIPVQISAVLGRTEMQVSQLLLLLLYGFQC